MMHGTPRELRKSWVMGERIAAKVAGVSRDTLRAYELDVRLVKLPGKRWLCDSFYADLAAILERAAERKRVAEDGSVNDASVPDFAAIAA